MRRFAPYVSLTLLAAGAALPPARLAAQELAVGARIRIIPIGVAAPTEGSLVIMRTDTVRVRIGLSNTVTSMSMDSVRAVDWSHGDYASFGKVMRDGAIGLVTGVGVVALIGAGVCHHSSDTWCGLKAAFIAVPVGAAGLIGGIVIGRSHTTEHWERVYERPSTALLIGPAPRGGFEIGMSIAFGDRAER